MFSSSFVGSVIQLECSGACLWILPCDNLFVTMECVLCVHKALLTNLLFRNCFYFLFTGSVLAGFTSTLNHSSFTVLFLQTVSKVFSASPVHWAVY